MIAAQLPQQAPNAMAGRVMPLMNGTPQRMMPNAAQASGVPILSASVPTMQQPRPMQPMQGQPRNIAQSPMMQNFIARRLGLL